MVENNLLYRTKRLPSENNQFHSSLTAEHNPSFSSPMQARSNLLIPYSSSVIPPAKSARDEFSSQTSHRNHESGEFFTPSAPVDQIVDSINNSTSNTTEISTSQSTPPEIYGRDEDAADVEQKIIVLLRQSLQPFSDRLDPFAQLPTRLTRFQEHLVSFYLLYYPKVTYGLSPRLQPHPVATNFAIAINTPACFQVALARSALYRLNLQKFVNEEERRDLEVARIRHQGNAIRMVRKLTLDMESDPELETPTPSGKMKKSLVNTQKSRTKQKDYDALIASMISLGTLDRRSGADTTASMHFSAVRRLLRAAGGPLGLSSVLLTRVMVHFECIYGTTTGSYIWDREDFPLLLEEANVFLDQIWELWSKLSEIPSYKPSRRSVDINDIAVSPSGTIVSIGTAASDEQVDNQTPRSTSFSSTNSQIPFHPVQAFALPPDSTLRLSLIRPLQIANEEDEPTPQQRSNLIFQLTCLLTLAQIVTDHLITPATTSSASSDTRSSSFTTGSSVHSNTNSNDSPPRLATTISPSDLSNLQSYLAPLFTNIENAKLSRQPCNNHMWLLQVFDHSSTHSRRIWRAAAFVWVLRHVGWKTQEMVKEWLAGFLSGEILQNDTTADSKTSDQRAPFRLNAFHFSYDTT